MIFDCRNVEIQNSKCIIVFAVVFTGSMHWCYAVCTSGATAMHRSVKSFARIYEEKAIFNYNNDGAAQLMDMYNGNSLTLFKPQGCDAVERIIGPLCYVAHNNKDRLADICTGKELRALAVHETAWCFPRPYLQKNARNRYSL